MKLKKTLIQLVLSAGLLLPSGLVGLTGCSNEKPVAEQRNQGYNRRFTESDIANFQNEDISPELANAYSDNFYASEIKNLAAKKIDPKTANSYQHLGRGISLLSASEIIRLQELGLTSDKIEKYPGDFKIGEIVEANELHLDSKTTQEYHKNQFNMRFLLPQQILELHKLKVPPKKVQEYDESFSCEGVIVLIKNNISSNEANKYAKLNWEYRTKIDGHDIIDYKNRKVSFEEIEKNARQVWLDSSIRN